MSESRRHQTSFQKNKHSGSTLVCLWSLLSSSVSICFGVSAVTALLLFEYFSSHTLFSNCNRALPPLNAPPHSLTPSLFFFFLLVRPVGPAALSRFLTVLLCGICR